MITNKHSVAVDIDFSHKQTGKAIDNVFNENGNGATKTPRQLFEEFYSGVTLHGFRFLFEGNPLRRITWLFITAGVFAFSIYLFYGLFEDFLLNKTITSFSKRFAKDEEAFPTITIFPNNPYSVHKTGPGSPLESDISSIRSFEWSRDEKNEEHVKMLELIKKQNVTDFMSYL